MLNIFDNSSFISCKKKINNPIIEIIHKRQQIYDKKFLVVNLKSTSITGTNNKNKFIRSCPEYLNIYLSFITTPIRKLNTSSRIHTIGIT